MSQTIEIIVSPDGQTKIETRGFHGPACREASRFIEQAIGQQVGEQFTAEFHQRHETRQANQQRP